MRARPRIRHFFDVFAMFIVLRSMLAMILVLHRSEFTLDALRDKRESRYGKTSEAATGRLTCPYATWPSGHSRPDPSVREMA